MVGWVGAREWGRRGRGSRGKCWVIWVVVGWGRPERLGCYEIVPFHFHSTSIPLPFHFPSASIPPPSSICMCMWLKRCWMCTALPPKMHQRRQLKMSTRPKKQKKRAQQDKQRKRHVRASKQRWRPSKQTRHQWVYSRGSKPPRSEGIVTAPDTGFTHQLQRQKEPLKQVLGFQTGTEGPSA